MSVSETTSGNRGEWSEIYVFLKLLADGKLFSADKDLNKIPNLFYPILAILRNDASGKRGYFRNSKVKVVAFPNKNVLFEIDIDRFVVAAELLLERIKGSSGSTFHVQEISEFLTSINVQSIKARSKDKRDITVLVHDLRTNMNPVLGFSIKSNLGSPSTLLNPGKTTNFVFRICGKPFSPDEIQEINDIQTGSKIRDRLSAIEKKGRSLQFHDVSNQNFKLNLKMIDTVMPEIVAEMLLHFYRGQGNSIDALLKKIKEANPLGFDLTLEHPLYAYKVKSLLTDIALGMTPAKLWKGRYDATGGYIIVKSDGDLVCYHIYNRNEFQQYLLDNTRLDTPSTTRYDFGSIYTRDGQQYINLNLQIRFK